MQLRRFSEQGGAEITLGSLWCVASILSVIAGLITLPAGLFDVAGLAAVILLTRHPRVGFITMAALLVVSLLVVDPSGYGFLWVLGLIGVVVLVRLRRIALAAVQTLVSLATVTSVALQAERDPQLLQILLSVVIAGALAWAIGWGFRRDAQLTAAKEHSTLQGAQLSLAGDLHDFVARDLTVISMRAEAAIARGGASVEELQAIAKHSRAANQFLRETAIQLDGHARQGTRPTITVATALERGRQDLASLGRELIVEGDMLASSHIIDTVAGRLLHEALHNAAKHGSGNVTVRFFPEGSRFRVEVANITTRAQPTRGPSLGTKAMRQRATVFGGELTAHQSGDTWLTSFVLPHK